MDYIFINRNMSLDDVITHLISNKEVAEGGYGGFAPHGNVTVNFVWNSHSSNIR